MKYDPWTGEILKKAIDHEHEPYGWWDYWRTNRDLNKSFCIHCEEKNPDFSDFIQKNKTKLRR